MLLRRIFLMEWTALDLWRMTVDDMRREPERRRAEEQRQAAIAFEERRRAYWHLVDTLAAVQSSVTSGSATDVKQLKRYRSALKRALNSLEH